MRREEIKRGGRKGEEKEEEQEGRGMTKRGRENAKVTAGNKSINKNTYC